VTFDLDFQPRPSDGPNTRLCEFGPNTFSDSRDFMQKQKKTQTAPKTEPSTVH